MGLMDNSRSFGDFEPFQTLAEQFRRVGMARLIHVLHFKHFAVTIPEKRDRPTEEEDRQKARLVARIRQVGPFPRVHRLLQSLAFSVDDLCCFLFIFHAFTAESRDKYTS